MKKKTPKKTIEAETTEELLDRLEDEDSCAGDPDYYAVKRLVVEHRRLLERINTPETEDFFEGVRIEIPHQIERWGTDHDAGKTAADWFWLIGYLAGKALFSFLAGDIIKAKHHTITVAAAAANWHSAISGGAGKKMRPGKDRGD